MQLCLVDSRFRSRPESTTASRFGISMKNPPGKVRRARLLHAQIPPTYNVSASLQNNVVGFNDSTFWSVTMPDGAWGATAYAAELQSRLNASPSAAVFTVSMNTTTFKFTIMQTGVPSVTFNDSSASTDTQHLERLLGIPVGQTVILPDGVAVEFPNIADFTSPNPILLNIGQFNTEMVFSRNQPHLIGQWALYKTDSPTGGNTHLFNAESLYMQSDDFGRPIVFETIDVRLVDVFGRDLALNGGEISFLMELHFDQSK